MRRVIVERAKSVAAALCVGLDKVLGARQRDRFGILMYHRTTPVVHGLLHPSWNVTPERLRLQISGLLDVGYQFWPLEKVLSWRRQGRTLPPKTIVLTFDDGYASNYLHAWPVLRELQVPATIFVATNYVGLDSPMPFDRWGMQVSKQAQSEHWRPLTWDECRELQEGGLVSIASHTHVHDNFSGRAQDLENDMTISLATLEQELSYVPKTFAFPYGSRTLGSAGSDLVETIRTLGFDCSLTTEIELNALTGDPFTWGRLEVVDSDCVNTIQAKLNGWFEWMNAARELFRKLSAAKPNTPASAPVPSVEVG